MGDDGDSWNDNANWSDTQGGAGGFSYPTSADDAVIILAERFSAYTINTGGAAACKDLTMNTNAHGFGVSVAGGIDIYGSFDASGSVDTVENPTFKATTTGHTIGNDGHLLGTVTFNGVGGGWTLVDDVGGSSNTALANPVHLLAGHLNTGNFGMRLSWFHSTGDQVRELTLGSSTIEMKEAVGNQDAPRVWEVSGSNFTLNAGTSTIDFQYDGNQTKSIFYGGGKTYYNVQFSVIGLDQYDAVHMTGNNTFNNLSFVPNAAFVKQVWHAGIEGNQTINGTFTATGESDNQRVLIYAYKNAPITITAAAVSLSYVTFQDVTGAGAAASFTGTRLEDFGGNSGITFPSTTRYWVGNGGNWNSTARWAASSGGTSGETVPLAQDDVIFDANSITSGGQTITYQMRTLGHDVDFSAVANSPTFNMASSGVNTDPACIIFGDLRLSPTMLNFSGESLLLWGRNSVNTLDSNGAVDVEAHIYYGNAGNDHAYKTASSPSTASSESSDTAEAGGAPLTMTLVDNLALSVDYELGIIDGTFDTGGYDVSAGYTALGGGIFPLTLNMNDSTWTVAGSGGYWNVVESVDASITINSGTSEIIFQIPSGGDSQSMSNILENDQTYYNVTINGSGDGDTFYMYMSSEPTAGGGEPIFNNFTITGEPIVTYWQEGYQYTFNVFTANGSLGSLIEIETLIQDEDNDNDFVTFYANQAVVSYVQPTNNHAAGPGIEFDASEGGVDGGGNVNWFFGGFIPKIIFY